MSGTKGASGGPRPGSGAKPKSDLERVITGNPGRRGRVLTHPGAGEIPIVAPIVAVAPPDDLPSDERVLWDMLAPHALAARTLTPATALAFRVLCRNLVIEDRLAIDPAKKGGADHRGMLQRVDAELLRFNLAPCGKALYTAEPVVPVANPLERFLTR